MCSSDLTAEQHPNADKLRVCTVNAGAHSPDGPLQIVCGAPNARAGIKIPLATVGAGAPSALGVVNYAIPLASFTCSPGTMSALQTSGVTSVAVKFTGDKNPSAVAGEFNTIAVGYIGFMK